MGIKYFLFLLFACIVTRLYAQPETNSIKKIIISAFPNDTSWVRIKKSFDTSVQSHNWKEATEYSNDIANLHFAKFRFEEAIASREIALHYAQITGDKKVQGICNHNIGYIYYKLYKYPEAMAYLLQALKLTNETEDLETMIRVNNSIGMIYKYLEDYDRSLNYFMTGYKAALQIKGNSVKTLLLNLFMNIGNCEDRLGNYRQGIVYYRKYLELDPNDRYIQVLAYNNIAQALLKLNEVDSAEALFTKAFAVEDTIRNPTGRAYSYYDFSLVAFAKKDYYKAIAFALKAKAGAQKYRLKTQEWLSDKILADCYQQTGQYQLANENMLAYTAVRDSIFLRQRIDRVGVLDATYRFELETGKKQQEITLLQRENDVKALQVSTLADKNRIGELQLANVNREKTLAQLQLSNLNKEKALAQLELSNLQQNDSLSRLKLENYNKENAVANMQLKSLNQQMRLDKLELSLQRRNQLLMGAGICILLFGFIFFYRRYRYKKLIELEKIRTDIAADFHDDLGSTLSSIALHSEIALRNNDANPQQVQKLLMQIGESSRSTVSAMHDMIWSIQPQHDNMEQLIFRMREYAYPLAEAKNIELKFQADDAIKNIRPPMDMRKNMYLIFKETLNNAFKYADAGHIRVQLVKEGDLLKLAIEDDGKGFNLSNARQGNGLRNMHKRAEQSGGKLILTSHNGKGTQMMYSCPIA